jgi:putative molybdopterin biosynthesis protein
MSSTPSDAIRQSSRQTQFLDVLTRDEAARKFEAALKLRPLGIETVPLLEAAGRVLATHVVAGVDVPAFDRSNVDGFAVRSADLQGADEEQSVTLLLTEDLLSPGKVPQVEVRPGRATVIATGGMVPRGADAVVMIEQTEAVEQAGQPAVAVRRMLASGANISFAGSDITQGETVLWSGQVLTARELGVLAALGRDEVAVFRRPRVAIISTGDEIVAPGSPLPMGAVYDSNAAILAATVRELGGEPVCLGTVRDDLDQLRSLVRTGLECDMVLLSGGTSKGAGDLSYQVVSELPPPGIVAHGVALKPGKPICLAVTGTQPVVVLPGFPTSAIFTFHEFVAPVLRLLAGRNRVQRRTVPARVPLRINSARGRTEYVLVGLVRVGNGWTAYPMGKGSGSVTTFSGADGFITIPQQTEFLDEGNLVEVTLLDEALQPADLVVIGSHCVGLDLLLGEVRAQGFSTRVLTVGSQGGLAAVRRGECDIAGVHLCDPATGEYNRPFVTEEIDLLPGYGRQQCLIYRRGDQRFEGRPLAEILPELATQPGYQMINRNVGSGTRILIDELLLRVVSKDRLAEIPGYRVQTKSHNAVAAAIAQGRADWGVAIDTVARQYALGTLPVREEQYDFLLPRQRRESTAARCFVELLKNPQVRDRLRALGFQD